MYSLYRAWLALNPCTVLPSLPETSVPLNLSLSTPGHVPEAPDVTLQVGPTRTHFSAHRGVLSTHSGFFKAALANHSDLLPIAVPNVNVDEFSSLLTFMYTGYLDLNVGNIYNILLATHILHMPRALELCRNFLLQQNQHASDHQRVNVIKPIASRKMAPQMQEIFTPNAFGCLTKSEDTPFKVVRTDNPLTTESTSKIEKVKSNTNESEKTIEKKNLSKTICKKRTESLCSLDKIIIDVACCDGPVRFHRVVNKNYGVQDTENFDTGPNPSFKITELSRSSAMNKAMNENIMEKLNSDNQSNEVFTCVYCNHTFKSQYCYQKHARRHLYPASIDKVTQVESKREVKLLDMNVQYYPCKTCGSKFPSYYFVHKHRKMCHADEVLDKNGKTHESGNENTTSRDESSSCSAIDVEAIHNENEQEVT
ncbi:telomere zinc finger-associated protein [Sitophilus oryzae]|uniref:Telomere zinc finger-associated protein n=1 Tax=Sitophilus oryzae TaxID=7048 RepID=A0A6J2X8U5_SITOR|nr:telomere zinc finger-associated protein [Sitophilus oryzae]XP_030747638.1 telomere zinc finger-associated protein [Sitophilus oryzae]